MDARQKASQQALEKYREEIALLKNKVHKLAGQHTEESKALATWMQRLQNTSFGRYLVQNKHLDGSWINYLSEPENSFWFNEVSTLAAMRIRYETVRAALESRVFAGINIGVFPAAYEREWISFKAEGGAVISGVKDRGCLLQNENTYDLVVRNTFLYDENQLSDDIYAYIYASLKPGGYLLSSHWTSEEEPQDDILFSKLLGWEKSQPLSLSNLKARLRLAGFQSIQTLNDDNSNLRSVSARKPDAVDYPEASMRSSAHAPRRMTRKGVLYKNVTLCWA